MTQVRTVEQPGRSPNTTFSFKSPLKNDGTIVPNHSMKNPWTPDVVTLPRICRKTCDERYFEHLRAEWYIDVLTRLPHWNRAKINEEIDKLSYQYLVKALRTGEIGRSWLPACISNAVKRQAKYLISN